LWLSRAKLDAYAKKEHDWSPWRDIRHIKNEPELVDRLRRGLAEMCEGRCVFEDVQETPEAWSVAKSGHVRFATLDPTVHALETQVHFVGHATVLVSSHGGALGLSLFLPPGDATVVELQVEGVAGNYHFQHMAKEMGHGYEMVRISTKVDVDAVWEIVKRWVEV
jgi:O-acetylhomoserine/O-acetylserine sulfhydrylase-like pyridoxal-dependent enzyme